MILFLLCFFSSLSAVDVTQDCTSKIDDVSDTYDTCFKDAEKDEKVTKGYSMLSFYEVLDEHDDLGTTTFKTKDICSQDYDKINCLENAHKNVIDCSSKFQNKQLENKILALKAKTDFECSNGGKNRVVLQEMRNKCISKIKTSINTCDDKFDINEQIFVPNFNFEIPKHDSLLLFKADCIKKAKWMKCIFNAYSHCENKIIAVTLKNYYSSIYGKFSLCTRLFVKLQQRKLGRNQKLQQRKLGRNQKDALTTTSTSTTPTTSTTSTPSTTSSTSTTSSSFTVFPIYTTSVKSGARCRCAETLVKRTCKYFNSKSAIWVFDYVKYYFFHYFIFHYLM